MSLNTFLKLMESGDFTEDLACLLLRILLLALYGGQVMEQASKSCGSKTFPHMKAKLNLIYVKKLVDSKCCLLENVEYLIHAWISYQVLLEYWRKHFCIKLIYVEKFADSKCYLL